MWEKVMIWENSTETSTLPCVKRMTSASSMHEAEHPKPVLWDNPEGKGGEGSGRGVQDVGGHMFICGWFMLMYSRNHHNTVNQLSSKNKYINETIFFKKWEITGFLYLPVNVQAMKLHSQTHILCFHLSWLLKKNHQEPEIKHNGQLNEKKKVFHRTDIKI